MHPRKDHWLAWLTQPPPMSNLVVAAESMTISMVLLRSG
jgi:hypothetical protein